MVYRRDQLLNAKTAVVEADRYTLDDVVASVESGEFEGKRLLGSGIDF